MTLASASERIRGMEDELGVALLIRDRRGVRLTPAGTTLLHHARLMLHQMDCLYGDLGKYGVSLKGHVQLLCNTAAMSEYLPEIISGFLLSHPGVSVSLEERQSHVIVDAVRNKLCDLGLVSDAVDLIGLEQFDFKADPLALIVPQEHALSSRSTLHLAQTLDYAFVGLAEGSALQEHLMQQARRLGRRIKYRVRLRSFEEVCWMVGRGVGVGVVPDSVAERYSPLAGTHKILLADPWAARKLILCARNFAALPRHTQSMAQHILSAVA